MDTNKIIFYINYSKVISYKMHLVFRFFILLFLVLIYSCNNEIQDKINNEFDFEIVNVDLNLNRIINDFNKLASFGDNSNKANERIAYSDYNIEALEWIKEELIDLNLQVYIDYAGNLIAKRKGLNANYKPIAFGSHIDCVPNGGHYDGQIGVLAGIEIFRILNENNIVTEHPLEFIVFSNEEGGVFGSRALAGVIKEETMDVMTASGLTNREGVYKLGGDASKIFDVTRKPNAFHSFLELHIEQGATLEEANIDIGVVQGIVGLRWWDVEITGFANHAGTTPMNRRKDAMLAASEFSLAVNEIVNNIDGSHVGTVGRINAFPGVPNVIPGKVILSLELRDLSNKKLDLLFKKIKERSASIANKYKTPFEFRRISATGEPALTSLKVQNIIEQVSNKLNLSSIRMPSGAGHDAQEMALIAPTGMIFIPSKDGVSHSPEEYSTFEQVHNGYKILFQSILALDKISNFY